MAVTEHEKGQKLKWICSGEASAREEAADVGMGVVLCYEGILIVLPWGANCGEGNKPLVKLQAARYPLLPFQNPTVICRGRPCAHAPWGSSWGGDKPPHTPICQTSMKKEQLHSSEAGLQTTGKEERWKYFAYLPYAPDFTPMYFPKRNESTCLYHYLCKVFHGSFINMYKVKLTHISITDEWMKKL